MTNMIPLQEAHQHICNLNSLQTVPVSLEKALGRVCSTDISAATDCPTMDSSSKDGFAVLSTDIEDASVSHPVTLTVTAALTAGDDRENLCVTPGTAIRIMTGAPVPSGATAVLASEFTQTRDSRKVMAFADSEEGRNILRRGSDIVKGQKVMRSGDILHPAHLGLLAASGINEFPVYQLPEVAVVATGSELVLPGERIHPGKVAASNMVAATAELQKLGIKASTILLRDNLEQLTEQFGKIVQRVDVLITCGGVLDGDKDLTMRAMERIGMEKIFHRVRIGPGKGACMGRVGRTLVFNLPGGPPSNHVALFLLALPGIRRLMGFKTPLPQKRQVIMAEECQGQENWTQLIYGGIDFNDAFVTASPFHKMNRFEAMTKAELLIEIPENLKILKKNTLAEAWFF